MSDEAKNEQPEVKTGRQYIRKWRITIYKPAYQQNENGQQERDPEHDIEMDVSQLRCVFRTEHKADTAITMGTLVVYNMNIATEKSVIETGFQISIYGGYQEGQYWEIFTGDVVQIFRNLEDGVDYRLEIIAMKGAKGLYDNFVRANMAAGSEPRDIAKAIAKNAREKLVIKNISENLSSKPLPRGKVFYGTPAKYYRNICVEQEATYLEEADGSISIQKVSDPIPEGMVLELTPETGLVGTPVYGDDGIRIKMLLDARVQVNTLIRIDNELIRRQAANFSGAMGGKSAAMPQSQVFDQDGEYQVFSVVHSGDTWGDDWSTEVVGVGRNGRAGLLTPMNNIGQTMRG